MARGAAVGASFGTVFGLIVDGRAEGAAASIAAIKGRRRLGRPLSVCLPDVRFSRLLDPARIHPALRSVALDGDALSRTLSSLCFVRAPIRDAVAGDLPAHLVSRVDGLPYLQSLDPGGLPGISALMSRLWRDGVEFPAVTSMNESGEPEIVTEADAIAFSRVHHLPALLRDPWARTRAAGSLTILEIGPHGLRAARHGVIPVTVLQQLVDVPIDDALTEPGDFPALQVPAGLLDDLDHHARCRAALMWLGTQRTEAAVRAAARCGLAHPWPRPMRLRGRKMPAS